MAKKLLNCRYIALALVAALLLTALLPVLSACNQNSDTGYTLNEYISKFPATWNTHNGTTDADEYVQGYTEIGLYDFTLSEDRTTYAFIDEMAVGDPKDVTATTTGYGIAEGDTGKAWEITLNPDATWENGTKITAEDYVWSMERVLSPKMKNSAASTYITGNYALYNANNYYNSGSDGNYQMISEALTEAEVTTRIQEKSLYFSLDKGTPIAGALALRAYHDMFTNNALMFCKDKNGENRDWFEYLDETYGSTANEYGYILVTDANVADIREGMSILAENVGTKFLADWTLSLSEVSTTYPLYTKIHKDTTYTDAQLNQLIEEGSLYFSFTKSLAYDTEGSPTLEALHNSINATVAGAFLDPESGENVFDVLNEKYATAANADGYVKITSENVQDFKDNFSVLSSSALGALIPNWYDLLSVLTYEEYESVPFSQVGIFKKDDTHFVLVFKNSLSAWQVKYLLTDNWIVYQPYYTEGYSEQGSLTLTSYGTTSGNYMGYGPYKLASYTKDKELVFERNENWYGYKEGATNYHEGQFQTDKIVCQIITNQATALLEFEKGNLDSVKLTANDMDKYKFSDYLLKRSASNTWSITFNSDKESLQKIEADGQGNRRILAYTEFRKALSLCLDRSYIGQNILVGSAAAFSFINSNYYYDLENDPDSIYRNTDQAKQAIVDLYGVKYGENETYKTLDDAYKAITGYDIDSAKANFVEAYNKAVAVGDYTKGDTVKINIYNNALSAQLTSLQQYMQTQVDAATKGTDLEGKIKIEFKAQQSGRLESIAQGGLEAVYYSFSGEYSDPNGMLGNFTDEEQQTIIECGFDPKTEQISVTANFDGKGVKTIEDTYYNWQKSLTAGQKYANADEDVKLAIMSAIESNLLSGFRTLPLCVGTDLTLRSKKVNYATENSNIFAMYGGVRLLTYNFNNSEWSDFCKNSSNLNYAS